MNIIASESMAIVSYAKIEKFDALPKLKAVCILILPRASVKPQLHTLHGLLFIN